MAEVRVESRIQIQILFFSMPHSWHQGQYQEAKQLPYLICLFFVFIMSIVNWRKRLKAKRNKVELMNGVIHSSYKAILKNTWANQVKWNGLKWSVLHESWQDSFPNDVLFPLRLRFLGTQILTSFFMISENFPICIYLFGSFIFLTPTCFLEAIFLEVVLTAVLGG